MQYDIYKTVAARLFKQLININPYKGWDVEQYHTLSVEMAHDSLHPAFRFINQKQHGLKSIKRASRKATKPAFIVRRIKSTDGQGKNEERRDTAKSTIRTRINWIHVNKD